jgi:hypothetical protein
MDVYGLLHVPADLVPIELEAALTPQPVWAVLKGRKSFVPAGIETPDHPACND